MVSIASPEGIALRVLSTLQHKLLTLVRAVLVAHPPEERRRVKTGALAELVDHSVVMVYYSRLHFI